MGGFKAQGVTPDSARYVIEDALAVERAGAYALLVEGIPPELTEFITKRLSIPVYSIGAGWPYEWSGAQRRCQAEHSVFC